jgi:anti-sigma factor RsiW
MSQHADPEHCAEVLECLDAWIDGDLSDAEAAAVTAHVDQCEPCQAELQLAETVAAELRGLPEFDLPERVLQMVRGRTRPTPAERLGAFFGDSVPRPVPAIAAVATVVVMVLVLSPWRGPNEPQYTDQEVARAAAETRLALAYVGSIAQRAELRVKARVLDEGVAAQTVRGVRRSLRIIGGVGTEESDLPTTPRPQLKGS